MRIVFLLSSCTHSSPTTFFHNLSHSLPAPCDCSFYYVKPTLFTISAFLQHLKRLLQLIYEANSRRCIVFTQGFSSDLFRAIFLHNSYSASFCRGDLPRVYHLTYGFLGHLIGILHYKLIASSSIPVTMHADMQCSFYKYTKSFSYIMYNYNDPASLTPVHPSPSLKAADSINFSVIGSLSSLKNIEEAIFIFYGFLHHTPRNLHLNIFGCGARADSLLHLVHTLGLSNHVSFLGSKPTYLVHKNTDILLHSSLSEGTSRSVIESLQSFSLVIHRNISGVYSIIDHGRNGFIYESPSHAVSLLPSILSLYDALSSSSANLPTMHTFSLLPESYSKSSFEKSVSKLLSLFPPLES